MVLQNPRVDFAVFEVARGGILREGLGYERNDVAVVLNVQPDHLGIRGIDTVEQLADVKAVPVEAVPRNGHAVLNADDPLVRAMRRRCSGDVVWFSMEPQGTEIRDFIDAHCRRGGKAVVLEASDKGDMIVVRHGGREMQLAWTHLLPATFGGRALMNVQNSLAAAAAAFAASAPLHDIRQGLRTFSTNYYLSPGRLNEIEVDGVHVFVDYCHNAPGMRMLGDFVDRVGEGLMQVSDLAKPSRIGVVSTAGDRRDEDMRELGSIAAEHFDVLVIREDVALRGRKRGETAELVAEGVRERIADGARCKQVEVVLDEIDATRHAMARANKGDLVVLCVDKHAAVLAELESWSRRAQAGARATDDELIGDPDLANTPRVSSHPLP
jgi:cyanophycin synthetase